MGGSGKSEASAITGVSSTSPMRSSGRDAGVCIQKSRPFKTASEMPLTSVTYIPSWAILDKEPDSLGLRSLKRSQCFSETGRPRRECLVEHVSSKLIPIALANGAWSLVLYVEQNSNRQRCWESHQDAMEERVWPQDQEERPYVL